MNQEGRARVQAQIRAEVYRRIGVRGALVVLGLLAFLFLATFTATFLRLAQLKEEAKWIGLILAALWMGIAFPLWLNRNTDAKYPEELLRLMDAARIGDAQSQRLLALRYLSGAPGVHKSSSECVYWLTKSAQAGDIEAAYRLSELLKSGNGTLPDEAGARRWLLLAMEAGHGPAAERLARWDQGEQEPLPAMATRVPDPEPELKPPSRFQLFLDGLPPWLRSAPLMALVLVSLLIVAAYLLAALVALVLFAYTVSAKATLLMGILVGPVLILLGGAWLLHRHRDIRYAGSSMRLVRRAESGNARAQLKLVEAYLSGSHGLAKDPAQALWWLRRCAEGGDLQAAYRLAQWIEQGLGHHRNRPLALQWLRRSAESGYGPAKHLLEHWQRRDDESGRGSSTSG